MKWICELFQIALGGMIIIIVIYNYLILEKLAGINILLS